MGLQYFTFIALACTFLPVIWLRKYSRRLVTSQRRRRAALLDQLGISLDNLHKTKLVGFFHPYCNAGGGGERVLWTAIAILQREHPDAVSVVYSGDTDATKDEIIAKVKARFDIVLSPTSLHFIFLRNRRWVEDSAWPRFTLLGQSLGSMYLAWEAVSALMPDLFIDTMGYAFAFNTVALLSVAAGQPVPVGAYVHYPTISTTMVSRVRARAPGVTNATAVASSSILSHAKLLYYRIFMHLYQRSLARASFLMVNSSWTRAHVSSVLTHTDPAISRLCTLGTFLLPPVLMLVRLADRARPQRAASPETVYPSCDTREMAALPLGTRERLVLSIAQFRPEKDHAAQLRAFAELLARYPEHRASENDGGVRLVLVGGSRNEGDATRVEGLRQLAKHLKIDAQTDFVINAPHSDVRAYLSRASVGLSTMVDEHFGINVVEFMAAGVIPVTHASGGPLQDIVVPVDGQPTGFHATDAASFAESLHAALTLPNAEALAMRERARAWAVRKFSEAEFERGWEASGWRAYVR